jgi:Tfp pilus assembly protein FimT
MQNNTNTNTARDLALQILPPRILHLTRGIGLPELLVTLALVSVVAGLATPHYHDAVEKRKVITTAKQIATFVNAAKSESIKHNKKVAVSYVVRPDGGWCIGATLGKDPCDCRQMEPDNIEYCAIASSDWILHYTDVQAAKAIKNPTGDGFFTFDPVRGILVDPTDGLLLGLHAGDGRHQVNLHMAATGRISLCQPAVGDTAERNEPCLPDHRQF